MSVQAWCVYCHRPISDTATVCPSCKKPLNDKLKVIKCASCGKMVIKGAGNCKYCGESPIEDDEFDESDFKPRRKSIFKRWWFWVLIVILLFVVVLSSGGSESSNASQMTKEEYIENCKPVEYDSVARDPDSYKGEMITFSGDVIQVSDGSTITMRINQLNAESLVNSDTWYATYKPEDGENRILEGDELTVYGECNGVKSYTSVLGSRITIPSITVKYYEAISLEDIIDEQTPIFQIGETWTVDGLWALTIAGVSETDYRNPYTDKSPAAVYYVTYEYSNIGYKSGSSDGLYISIDDTIVDSAGQMGYSYPGDITNYPKYTPVGASCVAECCIGVDHAGPFQINVKVYDMDFNSKLAKFDISARE